ncbi:hypothetical protein PAE4_20933 [Bacillus altitudinis]|nr:hypothetical protein PAE4_20933 [Bacillus altitudinis]
MYHHIPKRVACKASTPFEKRFIQIALTRGSILFKMSIIYLF